MSDFDEHRPIPRRSASPPAAASSEPAEPALPAPPSAPPAIAPATHPVPAAAPPAAKVPLAPGAVAPVEETIVAALKTCYDPEIPVDIYELGLIYAVKIDPATHEVKVEMTLTSPNCPAAQSLPAEVEQKVKSVPLVTGAKVEVVWEPPWSQDRMSEAAKLALGMY